MANREQLERLKAGVEGWNTWREEGGEIDLRGSDLPGMDLRGSNLSRADLKHANLWNADLSNADLIGTNLIDANLRDANLRDANLTDATLIQASLVRANLSNADFTRADLSNANLIRADLSDADLTQADLTNADLRRATLIDSNLYRAVLSDADLRDADLSNTDFYHADLSDADLRDATLIDSNLYRANLRHANLRGANLSRALFGFTSLGHFDLSEALGLTEAKHFRPSTIGSDTLELAAQGLQDAPRERCGEVEIFLRGAGVSEHFIDYFRGLIGMPIEFYSAFISYSHADKPFARRLYNDLQARGIRCWLDEKDGRIGDPIYEAVNQAIRANDRVILCCSFASLTSKWVDKELTMAFDKEDRSGQPILLPLDLDGALFEWTSAKAVMVRERIAARFKGWDTDARLYEERLERVVEAMRPRGDHDGE